jgi:hypothetical protein
MCARRIKGLLFGFIFVVAGATVMFFFARVSELECTHPEPSEVMCEKQVKWLGTVTVGKETIRDVRGASVDESCDEDGCTYRVMVRTGEGSMPLTGYYSSGYGVKARTAAQITEYVGRSTEEPLQIREGSVLLGVLIGGIFVLAGLGVALAGLFGRVR